ncbi:MAG: sigma-70 family RNA polymerase sigma factor [Micropruina sp.]|uniref:RNA polymerase sigma factor n=1 Tax=Micropruina sp. TaxID=2737536 RepID=UPI0039E4924F
MTGLLVSWEVAVGDADPSPAGELDFEQFVHEHSVALQQFAHLVIGNPEDARDAVQDALLGAMRQWSTIRGTGNPAGYVRRSIVNANVSRWRKRRREVVVAEVREDAASNDNRWLDAAYVGALTGRLSTRRRAALVLRYWDECSYAEIGEILACSEVSARSLVHRALRDLRMAVERGSHG